MATIIARGAPAATRARPASSRRFTPWPIASAPSPRQNRSRTSVSPRVSAVSASSPAASRRIARLVQITAIALSTRLTSKVSDSCIPRMPQPTSGPASSSGSAWPPTASTVFAPSSMPMGASAGSAWRSERSRPSRNSAASPRVSSVRTIAAEMTGTDRPVMVQSASATSEKRWSPTPMMPHTGAQRLVCIVAEPIRTNARKILTGFVVNRSRWRRSADGDSCEVRPGRSVT